MVIVGLLSEFLDINSGGMIFVVKILIDVNVDYFYLLVGICMELLCFFRGI